MIALAWNTAGRAAMTTGTFLYRVTFLRTVGLALCGLAGYFDARADEAGYWTARRSESLR